MRTPTMAATAMTQTIQPAIPHSRSTPNFGTPSSVGGGAFGSGSSLGSTRGLHNTLAAAQSLAAVEVADMFTRMANAETLRPLECPTNVMYNQWVLSAGGQVCGVMDEAEDENEANMAELLKTLTDKVSALSDSKSALEPQSAPEKKAEGASGAQQQQQDDGGGQQQSQEQGESAASGASGAQQQQQDDGGGQQQSQEQGESGSSGAAPAKQQQQHQAEAPSGGGASA